MTRKQIEAILIDYYKNKPIYEHLAEHFIHIFKDDPSGPKDNIYTINYRIKSESRLIEKITDINNNLAKGDKRISSENYKTKIDDLLGVRIICLRLSDILHIQSYLDYINEERIIEYIAPPDPKKSFILPVDPGGAIGSDIFLRSTGYSSIHYQIKLGADTKASKDLQNIHFELQLRTILEEAWGEIDHKYRYMNSRSGISLPDYINSGFYNLSAYLQVASQQAEYLCRQVENQIALENKKLQLFQSKSDYHKQSKGDELLSKSIDNITANFQGKIEKIFGFEITERTIAYLYKRFKKFEFPVDSENLTKVINKKKLAVFCRIFEKSLDRKPFVVRAYRNIDVVNAVNFSLINEIHGEKVSREGLKSVLNWRREHSNS